MLTSNPFHSEVLCWHRFVSCLRRPSCAAVAKSILWPVAVKSARYQLCSLEMRVWTANRDATVWTANVNKMLAWDDVCLIWQLMFLMLTLVMLLNQFWIPCMIFPLNAFQRPGAICSHLSSKRVARCLTPYLCKLGDF